MEGAAVVDLLAGAVRLFDAYAVYGTVAKPRRAPKGPLHLGNVTREGWFQAIGVTRLTRSLSGAYEVTRPVPAHTGQIGGGGSLGIFPGLIS